MGSKYASLFNPALSLCQCGTMASLRRGSWWVLGRETGSRNLQLGKKPTSFPEAYISLMPISKTKLPFLSAHDRCLEPERGQTVLLPAWNVASLTLCSLGLTSLDFILAKNLGLRNALFPQTLYLRGVGFSLSTAKACGIFKGLTNGEGHPT